mmetsp:Transcript_6096/g.9239  ORF Transcript_6096/g.9239 Transcript_6096/m.9239 type:complete len:419 (-) Transcript_6096:221-1477(-)
MPHTIGALINLASILAWIIRVKARRVPCSSLPIRFNKGNRRFEANIIRLTITVVPHSLPLDGCNTLALIKLWEAIRSTTTSGTQFFHSTLTSTCLPPAPHAICFWHPRIDNSCISTTGAQTPSTIITHSSPTKCHYWSICKFLLSIHGSIPPNRTRNLSSRIIPYRKFTLGKLLSSLFTNNRCRLTHMLDNSQNIHICTRLHSIQLTDRLQIISLLTNLPRIVLQRNLRILIKSNLKRTFTSIILHIRSLESSTTKTIDLIHLQHSKKLIHCLFKKSSTNIHTGIEKFDGKELSLSLCIGPMLDIPFIRHTRLDRPAILIHVERSNGRDWFGRGGSSGAHNWRRGSLCMPPATIWVRAHSHSGAYWFSFGNGGGRCCSCAIDGSGCPNGVPWVIQDFESKQDDNGFPLDNIFHKVVDF